MKYYKIIIILLVSIMNIGSSVYANEPNYKDKEMLNDIKYIFVKYKNINKTFEIQLKKIEEENDFLKAYMNYPYLKVKNKYSKDESGNEDVIELINNKIYDDILKYKNIVSSDSKEYEKEYNKLVTEQEKPFKYKYEAYSDYQVTYNKNNLISIPINFYEFTGGAHGLGTLKSYNYNLETGEELKLKDIFKEGVEYKEIVNKFIKNKIEKDKDLYFQGEGGFKGIGDNQEFYIDDEGIIIYFQRYEIAPYYVGIPKFKISFDEFKDVLRDDMVK